MKLIMQYCDENGKQEINCPNFYFADQVYADALRLGYSNIRIILKTHNDDELVPNGFHQVKEEEDGSKWYLYHFPDEN